MVGRITVGVEGLKELDAALGQLSKATARGVLRRVLVRRAEPLAERARELVHETTGSLKQSIIVSTRKPAGHDAGKAAFANVLREGGSRAEASAALRDARRASGGQAFAEAFVGPGRHPQAISEEFGTADRTQATTGRFTGRVIAHPFMRPAWDAEKDAILDGIAKDIAAEIAKTVARAASRAAKRAARTG